MTGGTSREADHNFRNNIYHLYDTEHRLILGYHWHPGGNSHVEAPHLHVYVTASFAGRDLAKRHFPTSRITLEDLAELLITEFEVAPRRADWRDVLARTRAVHETERTWPRNGRSRTD